MIGALRVNKARGLIFGLNLQEFIGSKYFDQTVKIRVIIWGTGHFLGFDMQQSTNIMEYPLIPLQPFRICVFLIDGHYL